MLAYLDALLAAISVRDTAEIERLLAHPLARTLTHEALLEAEAAAGRGPTGRAAAGRAVAGVPLRLLQLRHQTAHLLVGRADCEETPAPRDARRPSAARRAPTRQQMELPLPA